MTFKCPVCGKPLRKIGPTRYECTNNKCYVIEVKIAYNAIDGYVKKITKTDTILHSKKLKKEAK